MFLDNLVEQLLAANVLSSVEDHDFLLSLIFQYLYDVCKFKPRLKKLVTYCVTTLSKVPPPFYSPLLLTLTCGGDSCHPQYLFRWKMGPTLAFCTKVFATSCVTRSKSQALTSFMPSIDTFFTLCLSSLNSILQTPPRCHPFHSPLPLPCQICRPLCRNNYPIWYPLSRGLPG